MKFHSSWVLKIITKNKVSQSIQFELLESLRGLMNNEMGMENALGVSGLLDSVICCLNFSNLIVAKQIIEMLSVCTFYSEQGYSNVINCHAQSNKTPGSIVIWVSL